MYPRLPWASGSPLAFKNRVHSKHNISGIKKSLVMLAQPFCFVSLQSGINEFNSLILLVVIDFDFILTPWNSGGYFPNKKDRRSGLSIFHYY